MQTSSSGTSMKKGDFIENGMEANLAEKAIFD
jgi:hypothetical protein